MRKFVRALVNRVWDANLDLSSEQRNLFSIAYRNAVGDRRASWRQPVAEGKFAELGTEFKGIVISELTEICNEVLSLLSERLLQPKSGTLPAQSRIFYTKMAGDYHRYLSDAAPGGGHDKLASQLYDEARDLVNKHLSPVDPIRLGLALSYG